MLFLSPAAIVLLVETVNGDIGDALLLIVTVVSVAMVSKENNDKVTCTVVHVRFAAILRHVMASLDLFFL